MSNKVLKSEIYKERLADMYARYAQYIINHECDLTQENEFTQIYHLLALAHNDSRTHISDNDFEHYEEILETADNKLAEKEVFG